MQPLELPKENIPNSLAILWQSSPSIGLIFDIEPTRKALLGAGLICESTLAVSLEEAIPWKETSRIAFTVWIHWAKCAILERHESDTTFLTIRLQSQTFYERMVNRVLLNWLSVIENRGEYCSLNVLVDALKACICVLSGNKKQWENQSDTDSGTSNRTQLSVCEIPLHIHVVHCVV